MGRCMGAPGADNAIKKSSLVPSTDYIKWSIEGWATDSKK